MQPKNILFFVVFFSFIGCREENTSCDVSGKWFFNQVIRNDRVTNTLQDGYFEFNDDQTFSSNLFDVSQKYGYTISDGIIKIDTDEEFALNINLCSKDTLILEGALSMFDMQFLLTRTKKVDSLDLRSVNPLGTPQGEDDQLY